MPIKTKYEHIDGKACSLPIWGWSGGLLPESQALGTQHSCALCVEFTYNSVAALKEPGSRVRLLGLTPTYDMGRWLRVLIVCPLCGKMENIQGPMHRAAMRIQWRTGGERSASTQPIQKGSVCRCCLSDICASLLLSQLCVFLFVCLFQFFFVSGINSWASILPLNYIP